MSSVVGLSKGFIGEYSVCEFCSDGNVWVATRAGVPDSKRATSSQLREWGDEMTREATPYVQRIFALSLCRKKGVHTIWISGENALEKIRMDSKRTVRMHGPQELTGVACLLRRICEYYEQFEKRMQEIEEEKDAIQQRILRKKIVVWGGSKRQRLKELKALLKTNIVPNRDPTFLENRENLTSPMGYPSNRIGIWNPQVGIENPLLTLDNEGIAAAELLAALNRSGIARLDSPLKERDSHPIDDASLGAPGLRVSLPVQKPEHCRDFVEDERGAKRARESGEHLAPKL